MKNVIKKTALLIILFGMGAVGCKSNDSTDSSYNPNEFTLLVAASNDGEVGPCG